VPDWRNALENVAIKRAANDRPWNQPPGLTTFSQSSNAQCEQCNHTHSENQHRKCYRIVVQPMQPLVHGTRPFTTSEDRYGDNFSGRIGVPPVKKQLSGSVAKADERKIPLLGGSCDTRFLAPRRSKDRLAHCA
jgi:hypothetical protein